MKYPGKKAQNSAVAAVVLAAYRLDCCEEQWLRGIGNAFEDLAGTGHGTFIYRYFCRANRLVPNGRPVHVVGKRGPSAASRTFGQLMARFTLPKFLNTVHPQIVERAFLSPIGPGWMLDTTERIAAENKRPGWVVHHSKVAQKLGARDAWGLTAPDERGGGLTVACPAAGQGTRSDSIAAATTSLVPILQTAQRLRNHVWAENGRTSEEAIFRPNGSLESAFGAARSPQAHKRLSEIVRRFDDSRANRERGAWNGDAVWPGLIDGRWTLVERFESDGRRFIVAHANGKGVVNPRRLDAKQQQVAELAASGLMVKEIAAAVGCSLSSTETSLAEILRKLGVSSRTDLVLDYQRAPRSLARCVGELSAEEQIFAVETDMTLRFCVTLSDAEREVAGLVVRGHSNAEVARLRKTSVRTVANQVANIFKQYGVHSRLELLTQCLANR